MSSKSPSEIAIIREGARKLRDVLEEVLSRVQVGSSGLELSQLAESLILRAGGTPAFKEYGAPPFPAALCVSVNSCVVHGIPSSYKFASGDIIGFDIGMLYHGWYSDMARTVALEPISEKERTLIQVTREALQRAITVVRPGMTTGDIGYTVQSYVESFGFGVVRDLAGHGVGRSLHEAPEVPNFGRPQTGVKLTTGMVLALEPMISMGDWRVTIGPDHWSVITKDHSKTAHFEDMVLVTPDGHEVLTR